MLDEDENEMTTEEIDSNLKLLDIESKLRQKLFEKKLESLSKQLECGQVTPEEYSQKLEVLALEGEEEGFM